MGELTYVQYTCTVLPEDLYRSNKKNIYEYISLLDLINESKYKNLNLIYHVFI